MLDSVAPKKTGLAKATAILVTVFLVSLGLCGANALVIFTVTGGSVGFLFATAYLELAGMAVGAVGLVVVGIIAIIRATIAQFVTKSHSVSITEKDEDQ